MRGKKGVTFVELLISTILVGIVMLGVASFSMTVKHLQESSHTFGKTMMEMIAAMRFMTKDAFFAVGEEGDRGVWGDDVGNRQGICFRHDATPPSPDDYSDDTWVCYTHDVSNDILRCEGLANPSATCSGSSIKILHITQSNFFNIVDDVTYCI